jgi:hypothetical protein
MEVGTENRELTAGELDLVTGAAAAHDPDSQIMSCFGVFAFSRGCVGTGMYSSGIASAAVSGAATGAGR